MSLYSSPVFRIFNSENSESLVHRKPGNNVTSTRKPFVDRSVNCNTPEVTKKQKLNVPVKEAATVTPCSTTEDLAIKPEDYFSYNDVEDQFEDLLPYCKRLEKHHVFNILKSYVSCETPPPSPPVGMPVEVIENEYDSSFNSNKSYDDDMFFNMQKSDRFALEEVCGIDVPVLDIDDL